MSINDVKAILLQAIAMLDDLNAPPTMGAPDFSYGPALLEKAATNLCFPSNLSGWLTGNVTIAADSGAMRITETNASGFHEAYKQVTVGAGPHCHSFEVKALTATKGRVWFVSGGVGFFADFDLAAGTITAAQNYGSSTPHKSFIIPLADGWYRVGVSGTVNITSGYADIALRDAVGNVQYTGTGKAMLVRHAQSEAGVFPTSPITTISAPAMRPQTSHISTMTPITETTIALKARTGVSWPSDYAVLLHIDNNQNNATYSDLEVFTTSTGNLFARVTKNQSTINEIDLGVIAPDTDFNIALMASADGLKASLNGGPVQATTVTSWPLDLGHRRLGTQLQGIREWNSLLYMAEQWFSLVSDEQLRALAVL